MAKPNYAYEKRQRELAKKKKKEEKLARKTSPREPGAPDTDDDAPAEGSVASATGEGVAPAGDDAPRGAS